MYTKSLEDASLKILRNGNAIYHTDVTKLQNLNFEFKFRAHFFV